MNHRGDWENALFYLTVHQDSSLRRPNHLPVAKDGTSVLKYRIRAKW